ncbi:tumor necrosis factor receptor superfamily member 11B-like [Mizuhopecten yessoensis]|uniref:tumor necrosis factor receptor superfamily member 11B-like n=1 Tax=Mizuhopecten yessoensis TaxID=6573 RepID=UPI000B459483|nr:tumor necrosis factor receptor superfamily member 11B-like [Mizuhopecten yessoensis]
MKQKGFDNMKISAVVLAILLSCVLNAEAKDQEEDLKSDIEYVAPSGMKCLKCYPGTYLLSHCVSENTNSSCQQCKDGTFNSDNNIAHCCYSCDPTCETAELVPVVNCSHTSNLKCECPNGQYNLYPHLKKTHAVCQEFGPCQRGYGVRVKGTSVNNTTCKRCDSGRTFSSTNSSLDECQQCTKCGPGGFLTDCTSMQDRKCYIKPPDQNRGSSTDVDTPLLKVVLPVVLVIVIASVL